MRRTDASRAASQISAQVQFQPSLSYRAVPGARSCSKAERIVACTCRLQASELQGHHESAGAVHGHSGLCSCRQCTAFAQSWPVPHPSIATPPAGAPAVSSLNNWTHTKEACLNGIARQFYNGQHQQPHHHQQLLKRQHRPQHQSPRNTASKPWRRCGTAQDQLHGYPSATGPSHHCRRRGSATSLIARSIRTWPEALQFLDIAGGPAGRPPPQLQLELLLQSRLFQDAHSTTAVSPFLSGKYDRTVNAACGGSRSVACGQWLPLLGGTFPAADTLRTHVGDSPEQAHFSLCEDEEGGRLLGSGMTSPMAGTVAAAEDAGWQAGWEWEFDWELEFEMQLQRHSEWLREPVPPLLLSQQHSDASGPGAGWPPAAVEVSATARTAAAVMLPGHATAAAAAAATPFLTSKLTRFSPIPTMPTAAAPCVGPTMRAIQGKDRRKEQKNEKGKELQHQPHSQPQPRSQPLHGEGIQPHASPGNRKPHQRLPPADVASQAAELRSSPTSGTARGGREDMVLVSEFLQRVVFDAAVLQPEVWTVDEIALLVRRAAKLVYRYPGLLSTASCSVQRLHSQVGPCTTTVPRPSFARNSAVDLSSSASHRASMECTNCQAAISPATSDARGSGCAVSSQLRVRLQQLLLRVDGILITEPQPTLQQPQWQSQRRPVGPLHPASTARAKPDTESAVRAPLRQPHLSASDAVCAVWAAAALQLRLSPEGDVRRRLLEVFRPRRSSRQGRWRQPPRGPGTLGLGPLLPRCQQRQAYALHEQAKEHNLLLQHGGQARLLRGQPLFDLNDIVLGSSRRQGLRNQQLRRLSSAAGRSVRELDARDVANVLWAFAVLGWQGHLHRALRAVSESPPRKWVTRARLRLQPQLRLAPLGAATTPAAVGSTHDHSSNTNHVHSEGGTACSYLAAVVAVDQESGREGVGKLGSVLAEVERVKTFGGGGSGAAVGASRRTWPRVCGIARLAPSELTAVAWAAVTLNEAAGREGVTAVWAAQLFGATQWRLSRLSPSQLVDLLWSVGRGRRLPTGPWRIAISAALLAAVPRLVAWQVARAAGALAKLRISIPFKLAEALLTRLHGRLHVAEPSDVAAMVWALPHITYPYTEVFVHGHRRTLLDFALSTQSALDSLQPSQLVQLADGFARLRQLPGAEWLRMHREACIRLKYRFTEPNRRKIRQAHAVMLNLWMS